MSPLKFLPGKLSAMPKQLEQLEKIIAVRASLEPSSYPIHTQHARQALLLLTNDSAVSTLHSGKS
eukprot:SAG11_NODE_2397_length_3404_cov_1.824508_4_plen_65_part_00